MRSNMVYRNVTFKEILLSTPCDWLCAWGDCKKHRLGLMNKNTNFDESLDKFL